MAFGAKESTYSSRMTGAEFSIKESRQRNTAAAHSSQNQQRIVQKALNGSQNSSDWNDPKNYETLEVHER